MGIAFEGGTVRLTSFCGPAEAEPLLSWLEAEPGRAVDLSDLESIHPAVLQVLMARPFEVVAQPKDPTLATWLPAALAGSRSS